MVVELSGPLIWNKHDETDDSFLVLKGTLDIELRDKPVTLGPGAKCTLGRRGSNTDLWPVDEVHLLLIEPTGRAARIMPICRPNSPMCPKRGVGQRSGRRANLQVANKFSV